MDRSSAVTRCLAALAVTVGFAVVGCGGADGGGAASPASEEGQAQTEGPDGEPGRGDAEISASDDRQGGERDDSGSGSITQSSGSITQSSGGSSISQSAGGGSVSSSNVGGRGIKTFSGTGSTRLSFNVQEPSRLAWTNSEGRRFAAKGAGISIDSRAGRGEVALEAGDYENVRVSGASWTIVVRPR